jgi:hypothetical protein
MVMICSNAYSEELSLELTHFSNMKKKSGNFTVWTAVSKCFTVETATTNKTFHHCTYKGNKYELEVVGQTWKALVKY